MYNECYSEDKYKVSNVLWLFLRLLKGVYIIHMIYVQQNVLEKWENVI
jgi:hypothetical protein